LSQNFRRNVLKFNISLFLPPKKKACLLTFEVEGPCIESQCWDIFLKKQNEQKPKFSTKEKTRLFAKKKREKQRFFPKFIKD
jgi:hypothetical protein